MFSCNFSKYQRRFSGILPDSSFWEDLYATSWHESSFIAEITVKHFKNFQPNRIKGASWQASIT